MKSSILYHFRIYLNAGIFFFLLSGSLNLLAQESDCNCSSDAAFLHHKLKKTLAYKHQIGKKNTDYLQMHAIVQKQTKSATSEFECYFLLNKLVLSLNDNHMQIYGKKNGMSNDLLKDSVAFATFKKSRAYTVLPKPKLDLDSLETALERKSFEDKEGIYQRENYLKIGVYWNEKIMAYTSVVLSSETPIWERGELYNRLIPYGTDNLRAIGGEITSKRLISYTERIQHGLFLTMRFQKDPLRSNFSVALYPKSVYKREELSSEITYLKIGNFSSFYPVLSDAEIFYAGLESTLVKPNLIVDLRDNGGGGDRNSNILFKILRKYSKTNAIYLLINQRTGSNAEQFAHKLMGFKNITVLGDQSRGVVAYEIKNSTYKLPSTKFIAQLTSKKHQKYLELESKGVTPEVFLDYQKSWIAQIEAYITNK